MDVVTLAERPDLETAMMALVDEWPEFMLWDQVAGMYFGRLDRWTEYVQLAVDGDEVVGRAFSVPLAFGEEVGRPDLPPGGWDRVVRWAFWDDLNDEQPTVVAGLEITIRADQRGTGLAARMVEAMRDNANRFGFNELVIPVRPSRKHLEPATPMAEYAARKRPDGLPEDPWLRLHARAGADIGPVCPTAMTITGTLEQWRSWTGLPFDESGAVEVPGALVPVHVDVANDHVVYVEPNVWVRHRWAEPTA